MTTLILFAHDYPNGYAMCKRLHIYLKCLNENNESYELLVLRKNNRTGSGKYGKVNNFDSVSYTYLLDCFVTQSLILQKILNSIAVFSVLFYLVQNRRKFKNVFLVSFGWFDTLLIRILTHFFEMNLAIEVNEKPYVTYGNKSDIKVIKKLHAYITLNFLYRFIDGFVVISENLLQLVQRNPKKNAIFLKVPILVNAVSQERKVDLHKKPFLLHAGTLNDQKDGIIAVLEGFVIAHKKLGGRVQFVFTNRSTSKKTLNQIDTIIEENNLYDDVIFTEYLSNDQLSELMLSCYMAVVNRPENEQNYYNFSTKLGEYLSYGIPLISTSQGETAFFLEDNVNCLVVHPNNTEEIANSIVKIIEEKSLYHNLSNNALKLARDKFHYQNYSNSIAEFFKKLNQS